MTSLDDGYHILPGDLRKRGPPRGDGERAIAAGTGRLLTQARR